MCPLTRTSTQEVLPPYRRFSDWGVGVEPRTPQNLTSIRLHLWRLRFLGASALIRSREIQGGTAVRAGNGSAFLYLKQSIVQFECLEPYRLSFRVIKCVLW